MLAKNIANFIEENVDFFIASLTENKQFNVFLDEKIPNNNITVKEKLDSLDKSLQEALVNQARLANKLNITLRNDYLEAITGLGTPGKGIMYGDRKTLYNFLDKNIFVVTFFTLHMDDLKELINLWRNYLNKPTQQKNTASFSFFSNPIESSFYLNQQHKSNYGQSNPTNFTLFFQSIDFMLKPQNNNMALQSRKDDFSLFSIQPNDPDHSFLNSSSSNKSRL